MTERKACLGRHRVLGLAALLLDLATKKAARQWLASGPIPVVLGFRLELHANPGVAFGLSRTLGWVIGLLGLVLLAGLPLFYRNKTRHARHGLALLWAGGLSNALERLLLGGVTDFLFIPLPRLPFVPLPGLYVNLADLWLVLGAALLLLGLSFHAKGGGRVPSADTLKPGSPG